MVKNSLTHLGIIMDGNGRWAKKRMMPRKIGHQFGGKVFRQIADYCNEIGLSYLTVYAFSTENWKRPQDEVDAIMKILREYIDEVFAEKDAYLKKNMRIRFIGDMEPFEENLLSKMEQIKVETKECTGLTLNICLNYGGRRDIVQATRRLAEAVKKGTLEPAAITEEMISQTLYMGGQPDPEMILRTGGDSRLSNFLTWQSAYSEIIITETLWPDFKKEELHDIIQKFGVIERRFGGVIEG